MALHLVEITTRVEYHYEVEVTCSNDALNKASALFESEHPKLEIETIIDVRFIPEEQ